MDSSGFRIFIKFVLLKLINFCSIQKPKFVNSPINLFNYIPFYSAESANSRI